jgi:hypothetical protein
MTQDIKIGLARFIGLLAKQQYMIREFRFYSLSLFVIILPFSGVDLAVGFFKMRAPFG